MSFDIPFNNNRHPMSYEEQRDTIREIKNLEKDISSLAKRILLPKGHHCENEIGNIRDRQLKLLGRLSSQENSIDTLQEAHHLILKIIQQHDGRSYEQQPI